MNRGRACTGSVPGHSDIVHSDVSGGVHYQRGVGVIGTGEVQVFQSDIAEPVNDIKGHIEGRRACNGRVVAAAPTAADGQVVVIQARQYSAI